MLPHKNRSLVHAMWSTMICTIAMLESLNASVYAPVLVTSNNRQCKSCYKKTHAYYTLGGGGGAPAHLRFFLIIFTPSITFFAILSPKWGVTCVWLSCGGKPPTTMLVSPHTPMQECVGVCVSVVVWLGYSSALLCYCVTLG